MDDKVKGKLEFLDAEIKRYSTLVAAVRTQIKAEGEKAAQDGTKKEAYDQVKASLFQELAAVCRRYESLEECRVGIIFDELCDGYKFDAANPTAVINKEETATTVKTKKAKAAEREEA